MYRNVTARRMTQSTAQFAGLCLSCHDASNTAATSIRGVSDATASPTIHVHRTVKGWSGDYAPADIFTSAIARYTHFMSYNNRPSSLTSSCGTTVSFTMLPDGYRWSAKPPTTGTAVATSAVLPALTDSTGQALSGYVQTTMHQFPCSKCHAAHTSKLPRLMKTNCMDVGTATTSIKHANGTAYTYRMCSTAPIAPNVVAYVCHNVGKNNTATTRGWNSKTGW